MTYELETTVLGGLPITVEYSVCGAEPDVGIPNPYVDDWSVVAIAGRSVKKCDWLYRRIKENGDEALLVAECEEDAAERIYDY